MKQLTIEIPDDDWYELEQNWSVWNDESFALHAAYYFREALVRAGYMEEVTTYENKQTR